jgi:hypothetical protein
MVLATCLDSWKSHRVFTSPRASWRQRRRQPSRLHLFLERLEDRVVPDVSGNVLGGVDNPTVNPALASAGIVLPQFPNGPQNGLIVQPFFTAAPQGFGAGDQFDFSAQDQRVAQFRALGVNTQGQGNGFGQQLWISFALGFGSGTQPGEPWAPEYLSVNLTNRPSLPVARTVAYGPGMSSGPATGNRGGGGPAAGNPPAQPPGGGGGAKVPGDTKPQGDQGQRDQGPRNESPQQQEQQREENRNEERRQEGRQTEGDKRQEPRVEDQRLQDHEEEVQQDGPKGVKESESGPMAQEASWSGERGAVAAAAFAEPVFLNGQWSPLYPASGEDALLPAGLPAPLLSLEPAVELPALDVGLDWGSPGD